MARPKKVMNKLCIITGLQFPVTEFYKNKNTVDGLHPYSKKADNFRRRLVGTNVNTQELRQMFNQLLTKIA